MALEYRAPAIAQKLKAWHIGKLLACQYGPSHQAILTPAIESWALKAQSNSARYH